MKMSLELHSIDDDGNDVRTLTVTKEIGRCETYAETIISLTEQMKRGLFIGKMDIIIGLKEEFIPVDYIKQKITDKRYILARASEKTAPYYEHAVRALEMLLWEWGKENACNS